MVWDFFRPHINVMVWYLSHCVHMWWCSICDIVWICEVVFGSVWSMWALLISLLFHICYLLIIFLPLLSVLILPHVELVWSTGPIRSSNAKYIVFGANIFAGNLMLLNAVLWLVSWNQRYKDCTQSIWSFFFGKKKSCTVGVRWWGGVGKSNAHTCMFYCP